jgi:hypothetical protein
MRPREELVERKICTFDDVRDSAFAVGQCSVPLSSEWIQIVVRMAANSDAPSRTMWRKCARVTKWLHGVDGCELEKLRSYLLVLRTRIKGIKKRAPNNSMPLVPPKSGKRLNGSNIILQHTKPEAIPASQDFRLGERFEKEEYIWGRLQTERRYQEGRKV